jgi:precorrin-6B methylase 2
MTVTVAATQMIHDMIEQWPEKPDQADLNSLLRLVGRWRSHMLANVYVHLQGRRIWSGPFEGMDYVDQATEGALIPRLIGTYESELHPHLAAFAAEGLDCVIDVGCAEGYYAVGLARMMPGVTVYAYDIDEKARVACAELAARNGVGDRVIVGGEFKPDGFEAFAGKRTLVLVDTEGAEVDILQPHLSPALAGMNLIVETHDVYTPHALATMTQRFAPTHDIVRVDQQPKTFEMPPFLKPMTHLDQLIAVWEWRQQPTPWLVMRPKAKS